MVRWQSAAADICHTDASHTCVSCVQSKDKQLKLVDNMWHILTKEPGNEVILECCINWLEARVPKPSTAQ